MQEFQTEFYKKLFDSLENNAVLMKVEADGSYYPIWCSEEFAEMMEGTSEDIIRLENTRIMNTVHPDDRDEVNYLFRHHMTRTGANDLTIRKCTLMGKWIWVNLHYAFVQEERVQYAYCSYFDVTDIKENEIQLEAMYENLRHELLKVDDDTLSALRVNLEQDRIEVRLGPDLYDTDISAPDFSQAIRERANHLPIESERENFLKIFSRDNLMKMYEDGERFVSENMYSYRQDGRKCFVNYIVTVIKQPFTGHIIAFIAEKEYNNEKVNETLLEKVLAKQYDMITYLVDGQYGVVIGDIQSSQKGTIFPKERIGNYDEYIDSQVAPVICGTKEEKDAILEALRLERVEQMLSKKEPYEVNLACEIDGELIHKNFAFYLVEKETRFYILLKSDTTQMHQAQRKRNEQLQRALEEANQANIAKTAFLSSMSHEIRTPMNAIIGLDNIALKDQNLPAKTREQLEKIGGSARHLLGLINDILDMSRIESGRMVIKNEEFSFGNMMEEINIMINSQCQDKGLNYECNIHGKVDEYYIGDDMKLKQVLINILGNAVKFTPVSGTVSFLVECTDIIEDKAKLQFVIRDTGIGMDEDYLPKIFEAFSQENGSKTNAYGSSGLGMAITKNIVEMMGGDISVKSQKGVGSEFTVHVELKIYEKINAFENSQIRPQDMKVLVIDDDAESLEHAKLVLGELGIAADCSLSGTEALDMVKLHYARCEAYDLILVDLKMPEKSGIDIARDIRQEIGDESALIILMAYSWDHVVQEAIDAGVDSFMAKPLFVSGVMSELRQAIQKKTREQAQEVHRADLKGKRILLAEDVIINAEIMQEVLSMEEVQVEHAENGKMAVELFQNHPEHYYDLILMDIRMPVMDGLEATTLIRSMEREDAKEIPIVAMTANAFDEDVEQSLQVGMNAHLSKPVEPERLFETLQLLLP